jgi:hypothetical protein
MKTWLAALVSVLFASSALFPATRAENRLERLLARHAAALGGNEALAHFTSWRAQGTYQDEHGVRQPLPFTLEVARPDWMCFDMRIQTFAFVTAVDGTQGFRIAGDQAATPEQMPSSHAERERRNAAFDALLTTSRARRYLGKMKVDGRMVHAVRLDYANADQAIYYLDERTFLVTKVREVWPIGANEDEQPLVITRTFSDYRDVGGVRFPHLVVEENSQGWRRFALSALELNPPDIAAECGGIAMPNVAARAGAP